MIISLPHTSLRTVCRLFSSISSVTACCGRDEPMTTLLHEWLLGRPPTEGSLRRGRRDVQGTGSPHLRREPLFGQTLRRQSPPGRVSGSEEEPRLSSEAGR